MPETGQYGSARRGICMTYQCKFGTGNCWHVQLATDTVSAATLVLKLSGCETTGRIEREHDVASRGAMSGGLRKWNVSESYHGGTTEPEGPAASPVFQWRHVMKAIQTNSGERTASCVHIIKSSKVNMRTQVAHPISTKVRNGGNALCVVGMARSTRDGKDSITFSEERGHTRNTIACNSGATHSREGRRS